LGASAQLNSSAIGAVSYAWLPNDGTLSNLTIPNPIATPTTTTTYYVAITNTNGCTDLDTVIITVVPLPSPVITANGPTSFCIGGNVTLTSNIENQYQWSTGTNDTLQAITVNTSGTYTVTITNIYGCSSTATQTVTVYNLPPIDAGLNDSTCLSTNINLQASGGISYIWHPGSSLSDSTIANPIAGPVLTTTYTVVGADAGGCQSTDSVTITVLGNPSLPTIVKGNDTLYCTPATYASYQWYLNGSPIGGATNPIHVYTINGNYYVEVTNTLGCSSVSSAIAITDVGINEISSDLMATVYPNPASENLFIDFQSKKENVVQVTIIDITGRNVYSESIVLYAGMNRKRIGIDAFNKGIYLVQFATENGIKTEKLIIQ
jgi:hypothetical protein